MHLLLPLLMTRSINVSTRKAFSCTECSNRRLACLAAPGGVLLYSTSLAVGNGHAPLLPACSSLWLYRTCLAVLIDVHMHMK
jgi:hypothetical protein